MRLFKATSFGGSFILIILSCLLLASKCDDKQIRQSLQPRLIPTGYVQETTFKLDHSSPKYLSTIDSIPDQYAQQDINNYLNKLDSYGLLQMRWTTLNNGVRIYEIDILSPKGEMTILYDTQLRRCVPTKYRGELPLDPQEGTSLAGSEQSSSVR